MDALFTLSNGQGYDARVDEWLSGEPHQLHAIARQCFEQIRGCGDDVRELLHDGCPTACVGEAAFAYVNVFRHHVNLGFFTGAMLPDPQGLLEGQGKRMRHVKLRPGEMPDAEALTALINSAYRDVRARWAAESSGA